MCGIAEQMALSSAMLNAHLKLAEAIACNMWLWPQDVCRCCYDASNAHGPDDAAH